MEDLRQLKSMFCPPLNLQTVERVYTQSQTLEVAIGDLLAIAELEALDTCASSPEIPFTDSSESASSVGSDCSAIDFLGICFPGASYNYLKATYESCHEDVDRAIDCLLSEDFILQEGFNAESSNGGNSEAVPRSKSKSSQGNGSKKHGRKLSGDKDGTGDFYSCRLDWGNVEGWELRHWVVLEHRFEYILEMFPKLGRLSAVLALRKAGGDLCQAIDILMAPDSPLPAAPRVDAEVHKLREVFPQHSMVKLTVYALQWPGVDEAIRRLIGDRLPRLKEPELDIGPSPPEAWTVVAAKAPRSASHHLPPERHAPDELLHAHPKAEYVDIRKQVELLKEARQRAYHQAAKAYRQRRTCGQGAVAAFYSSEGRELTSRIAQLHVSAAQAYLRGSRAASEYLVDLHGLTVPEAAPLVVESVNAWYARETVGIQSGRIKKLHPFVIVTGAGNHSVNGVSRMKPMVVSLLKRHGWKFEVRHATIEVLGSK